MTDDETTVPDPPTTQTLGRILRLLEPARRLVNPKVYGADNLPEHGALPDCSVRNGDDRRPVSRSRPGRPR